MAGVKGQRSGGANKKPTHLHVIQGTFRKDRHAVPEARAPQGTPVPPRKLSVAERAEWDRMVARLQDAGTLSRLDDAALLQVVALHAEVEALRADQVRRRAMVARLEKAARDLTGEALLEATGQIAALEGLLSKGAVQLRQGHMALRAWLADFGLVPAARNRVKPVTADAPDSTADAKQRRFFGPQDPGSRSS